tara:strand:- start:1139 stop:1387 length:249 start_codon:yes stop_codon:yes gene_type:complete
MTTTIVYSITFLILCFVLYIAFKSINIGLDAKRKNKENLDDNGDFKLDNDLIEQIDKLKKMRDDGTLSEEEFNEAKRKILKD